MRRLLICLLGAGLWLGHATGHAAEPIRLGFIPIGSTLPLFCATEIGAWSAEGLEVQPTALPSGTRIIEAMAGGSLDAGFSATLSVLQAVEQGLDLVILAPSAAVPTDHTASALVALKDSGITGPAGLRGKVIGVNAIRSSINHLWAAEYLARGGVAHREATWQEVAFPHMAAALLHRRVDAVSLPEPFLTALLDSGQVTVLSPSQSLAPGMSVAVLTALRGWVQRRPAEAAAIQRGLRRGTEACRRDGRLAREILVKHTRVAPELAGRVALPMLQLALRPSDLDSLQDLARRHGALKQGVDLARLVMPMPGER